MKEKNTFAVFILTHRRPDNVKTVKSLREGGYTGKIYLVVDDLDPTLEEYKKRYGDEVVVFSKAAVAKTFDRCDNFTKTNVVVFARAACHDIACRLGVRYYMQLDDDYLGFSYRFDSRFQYGPSSCKKLDELFAIFLRFYVDSGATSFAFAQGGDFIGGVNGSNAIFQSVCLLRKCMNSFFCSTDRPIQWAGYLNEDVNAYTVLGARGALFLTSNQVSLQQVLTQAGAGGATDAYLDFGTYVKSFFTVMQQPSSVKIAMLRGQINSRVHHSVRWRHTTPMIVRESLRKKRRLTPRAPRC